MKAVILCTGQVTAPIQTATQAAGHLVAHIRNSTPEISLNRSARVAI